MEPRESSFDPILRVLPLGATSDAIYADFGYTIHSKQFNSETVERVLALSKLILEFYPPTIIDNEDARRMTNRTGVREYLKTTQRQSERDIFDEIYESVKDVVKGIYWELQGFTYPSILHNKVATQIQNVHSDFLTSGGLSVILALSPIRLYFAAKSLAMNPVQYSKDICEKLSQPTVSNTTQSKELECTLVSLEPGDAIYFDGEILHAGSDNPPDCYRLFYYFSEDGTLGFPINAVYKPFESLLVHVASHVDKISHYSPPSMKTYTTEQRKQFTLQQ